VHTIPNANWLIPLIESPIATKGRQCLYKGYQVQMDQTFQIACHKMPNKPDA